MFHSWEVHPVTLVLLKYLRTRRQDVLDQWANGGFDSPSFEQNALTNAALRGGLSVIDEILKFDQTNLRGNDE